MAMDAAGVSYAVWQDFRSYYCGEGTRAGIYKLAGVEVLTGPDNASGTWLFVTETSAFLPGAHPIAAGRRNQLRPDQDLRQVGRLRSSTRPRSCATATATRPR